MIKQLLYFLFGWLCLFSSWSAYRSLHEHTVEADTKAFQIQLDVQEDEMIRLLRSGSISQIKKQVKQLNCDFFLYQHDSLIDWSSNSIPVSPFADIHFPDNGLIQLQNGWYIVHFKTFGNKKLAITNLVQTTYPIENKHLINQFTGGFSAFSGALTSNSDDGAVIHDKLSSRNLAFRADNQTYLTPISSLLIELTALFGIGLILYSILLFLQQLPLTYRRIGLVLITLASAIFMLFSSKFTGEGSIGFDPTLFAYNAWIPNYFQLILFLTLSLLLLSSWSNAYEQKIKTTRRGWFLQLAVHFTSWFGWLFLIDILIQNSTLELDLQNLFEFNPYSWLTFLLIGFVGYRCFRSVEKSILIAIDSGVKPINLIRDLITAFGLMIVLKVLVFNIDLWDFIPLILCILIGLQGYTTKLKNGLVFRVLVIGLLAISIVTRVDYELFNRQLEEAKLYSQKLANEPDYSLEIDFQTIEKKLVSEATIGNLLQDSQTKESVIQRILDERYFEDVLTHYALKYSWFPQDSSTQQQDYSEIINRHCRKSELDTCLYYVRDYAAQLSYLARIALNNTHHLYIEFRSKKIPEEIGFPRLLIAQEGVNIEKLERYHFAKYSQGVLVNHYGSFRYPSQLNKIKNWDELKLKSGCFVSGNFIHFLVENSYGSAGVLSFARLRLIDYFSHFSQVFVAFGLVLLSIYLVKNWSRHRIQLGTKIQLVLGGLIFVAVVSYGISAGIQLTSRYKAQQLMTIQEKLDAIQHRLTTILSTQQAEKKTKLVELLSKNADQLADNFQTDINIYNTAGNLIHSTQPRIYNLGLLGEFLHPDAKKTLLTGDETEIIQREKIGDLEFYAAYHPLYNKQQKVIAYLNLQYVGKETIFNAQVNELLIGLIDVLIVLLLVTSIFAFIVSNWLTAPLRLLRTNLSELDLNQTSRHITYTKQDEIGELVEAYNNKINDLRSAAEQLAKNEREMAWREMAKQVAHEIKNPLTPMKLSIQHLQRSFDPSDPNALRRINTLAESLIEQIDGLTHIANAFSNFAQLPAPKIEILNIHELIANVTTLFQHQALSLFIEDENTDFKIRGDKDQLVRVFNNLITNAFQAIPSETTPEVSVTLIQREQHLDILIKDNGIGISSDTTKHLFVPYFTTKTTGTGLGLAMVKNIVENHNGIVWYEPNNPVGSIFTVRLPLHQSEV